MSNQEIPLPQVNQPINPQGQPDGFSPEEHKKYQAAEQLLAALQPILEDPAVIKYRELQLRYAEEAAEYALEVVVNPQQMRDRLVAHATFREAYSRPVRDMQAAISALRDRTRRTEELARNRELRRQMNTSVSVETTPNPT